MPIPERIKEIACQEQEYILAWFGFGKNKPIANKDNRKKNKKS